MPSPVYLPTYIPIFMVVVPTEFVMALNELINRVNYNLRLLGYGESTLIPLLDSTLSPTEFCDRLNYVVRRFNTVLDTLNFTPAERLRQFIGVSPAQTTLAVNELINDINYFVRRELVMFPVYTTALLPGGGTVLFAFASDGRKIGEAPGNGTGVPVYYSTGQWRVFSLDSPVLS